MTKARFLFIVLIILSSCEKQNELPDQLFRDSYNYIGVTFTNIRSLGNSYKLSDNIVVYSEILGYDSIKHTFLLSEKAGKRIRSRNYPTTPTPFAIGVDGEIAYIVNFIPGYSSQSCEDCITTEPFSYSNKYRITLGYPGNTNLFTGDDPRNAPQIIERLKNDRKLMSL